MLLLLLVACFAWGGGNDDACERWTERKAGECREAVTNATLSAPRADPNEPQGLAQPFHLRDQCELFPERKVLVTECVEKPTCEQFAECGVTLASKIFYPPDSPNLCAAFVTRGGSKQVGDKCAVDEDVKAGVAACMMVMDEKFGACAAEIDGKTAP